MSTISVTSDTTQERRTVPFDGSPLDAAALPRTGPGWLSELREAAIARFNDLGVPTLKHEEWRYTSLKPLLKADLKVAVGPTDAAVSADDVAGFGYPGLDALRLVFVNGAFAPEHSTVEDLPPGVTVRTFAEAFEHDEELLKTHLARYAAFEQEAFTALNTAFLEDGVLVRIERNAALEKPVHVLSITTSPDEAIVLNPRHLIVAEEGSRATVIEDYVALGPDVYFTNAVTEVAVGANAEVHHYTMERESPNAFNVNTLKVHQERDSRFTSHSMLFGGSLVRNNVNPVLDGEGILSTLNGVYVGRERQHLDNHMRVEHRKGQCESRQYYKGILADRSHGVFSGRIVVVQDAQQTDAIQSNQNLLLSPTAQAQAKPQLEIYADDVRCTHGATIGQMDEDALFYLRSRGLDEKTAKAMLVFAFASEALERMDLVPIRETVRRMLLERLPDAPALDDAVAE